MYWVYFVNLLPLYRLGYITRTQSHKFLVILVHKEQVFLHLVIRMWSVLQRSGGSLSLCCNLPWSLWGLLSNNTILGPLSTLTFCAFPHDSISGICLTSWDHRVSVDGKEKAIESYSLIMFIPHLWFVPYKALGT